MSGIRIPSLISPKARYEDDLDRLMHHLHIDDAGCWLWMGRTQDGYGEANIGKRKVFTHRLAYELYVGPIDEDLVIDHLCHDEGCTEPNPCHHRRCFHPEHLMARPNIENVMRSHRIGELQRNRMTCPRGHPYDRTRRDGHLIVRYCSLCERTRYERRKQAKG